MAIVLKGYFEIILFISLTLTSRKLVLGFAIRNQALITTQSLVERQTFQIRRLENITT